MDLNRSSFRGLSSLFATMAMIIAASRGSVSYSFTSPALPGASFFGAAAGAAAAGATSGPGLGLGVWAGARRLAHGLSWGRGQGWLRSPGHLRVNSQE